jgi:hypothetical protein
VLAVEAALGATALAAGLTSTWSPCGFSMVETIGRPPASRAGRAAACVAFALGALAGGTATFAGLAALGRLVHGAGGELAVSVGVAVLLAAAAAEARGVRVVPQIRRQVPEPWRRVLPLPVASGLYGVLLGLGFTTYVLTMAVWALAAVGFALGDLAAGAAIGLAFGAGRALPVVAIAPLLDRRAGARALELMAERPSLLRGFRLAAAVLLLCSGLALVGATARAAVPVFVGGTDPSVAGGLVAWDTRAGGLIAREAGAPEDPHRLGSGGLLQLPGRQPALGESLLAVRAGETVRVLRAADLSPVLELPLPDVSALAVSDRWLVYRASRPGGDRLAARPLADPTQERTLAELRAPAQLGRPALAGSAVVYHVADRSSSRIVEADLVTGRTRVLRRSRLDQLSNPTALDGALLYVRQTNLEQRLQLGPRRPGGRDGTLLRAPATARRDDGFEPGHSPVTRTPRATPPASRLFWTTALGPRFAYVSLVPASGARTRPAILRVARP